MYSVEIWIFFCYGLRLWILFKVCVFCFIRERRGMLPHYFQMEIEVQVRHLAFIDNQRAKFLVTIWTCKFGLTMWSSLVLWWDGLITAVGESRVCYDTCGEGCLITAGWVCKSKLWSPLTLAGSLPDNGDEDPTSLFDHL